MNIIQELKVKPLFLSYNCHPIKISPYTKIKVLPDSTFLLAGAATMPKNGVLEETHDGIDAKEESFWTTEDCPKEKKLTYKN
ncbi:MAG: hypothetical protein ACI4BG_07575 [Prevotella sp.]